MERQVLTTRTPHQYHTTMRVKRAQSDELTHLARASRSPEADDAASNDILTRPRSRGSAEAARLPVLRFLGRDNGCNVLPRPRSWSGA